MNLLLAAAAALTLALAGVGALRFAWPNLRQIPRSAQLALGFCAGCWIVTVIFFGAYLAGVSYSRPLVIIPVAILALAGLPSFRGANLRWNRQALLPAVFCLLALALSWLRPVYGYDAVMMWALKAKMMFFARTWPATIFDPFTTAHTDYPPLVPSAQAFVFFWLGAFDDVASRVIFAAFFAAGTTILWWLLGQSQTSNRWAWVLWWCALPVVMEQVKLSYADLPLAVYLLVFYGAAAAWRRDPARREWLWLAGIFGGMAFWVKHDALIGVGAGLLALLISRKSVWPALIATGLIAAPWRTLVWAMNLPSDFALRSVDIPVRTAQVAEALWRFGIYGGGYGLFWLVFLLALLLRWRRVQMPDASWLFVSFITGLVGVFAVYWFSKPDVPALLQTSLERVLFSLLVPAFLLVALVWPETRKMRLVVIVIACWSALLLAYRHTRTCVELCREFGGKTVAQQHVLAVEPELRPQIADALRTYRPGAHVQVLPKRSLWRHRFYYETYPYLIVDNSATNVITLAGQ